MSASIDPPPAPAHQCINASCGCNDLVSAGPCHEWCSANTTELADVERGAAAHRDHATLALLATKREPLRLGEHLALPETGGEVQEIVPVALGVALTEAA